MLLEQTWRWFGPEDRVTLRDARETGATGIVAALHEIPAGEVWPVETIRARQDVVRAAKLEWSVVESLDVTERIKMRAPGWQRDVDNFAQSVRNLAQCGIRTVAYNWMPLFSWMRTHLHEPAPKGGFTTRFSATAFAAFDLFMLKRKSAEEEWGEDAIASAHAYFKRLSPAERETLCETILAGLPGGHHRLTLKQTEEMLRGYAGISREDVRGTLAEFLERVCPVAEECGVRLCIHPDDPPRALLGLPRIVSTADDLRWILEQHDGDANSLTFCTGALGVRADNDLRAMVAEFAPRIGFLHLRSTERDPEIIAGIESFFEVAHLEGQADLIGIAIEIMREVRRRELGGDERTLPFRADHGQELLNDRERGAAPGYPAVGRLRGLAELRGAFTMAERWMTKVEQECRIP
ncbi:mannonate dehydratase [Edaphobacter acidisoli]|uniref:Mannonate dehydratase n=1 Tax=Edaphobacter acidisoli TaxID=2040573 RepID=A0A916VZ24_9BACT|nr:mannonate dehydratase [Edaphobacter acidisoli]GGA53793.1 mannonate dehydratase [Edaphobacter acidisoli]